MHDFYLEIFFFLTSFLFVYFFDKLRTFLTT